MIELRSLEDNKLPEWNSIVEQLPNATLFHTMEWLNFLEKAFHLEKLPMGLYQDGRLAGLFPMLMTRKGPFRILGSPLTGWNTPYMGPLIKAELLNEAMSAFNSLMKSLKADYVEVRFPQADLILPSLPGFHNKPVYTYILDLEGGENKAWNGLKRECRKAVRKALNNNVKIVDADERSWVEDFFPMLKNTFAKSGQVPTRTKQYYYDLWDYLIPTKNVKVLFAEHEGHRIAGLVLRPVDRGFQEVGRIGAAIGIPADIELHRGQRSLRFGRLDVQAIAARLR